MMYVQFCMVVIILFGVIVLLARSVDNTLHDPPNPQDLFPPPSAIPAPVLPTTSTQTRAYQFEDNGSWVKDAVAKDCPITPQVISRLRKETERKRFCQFLHLIKTAPMDEIDSITHAFVANEQKIDAEIEQAKRATANAHRRARRAKK